jgi:hypothetical protein
VSFWTQVHGYSGKRLILAVTLPDSINEGEILVKKKEFIKSRASAAEIPDKCVILPHIPMPQTAKRTGRCPTAKRFFWLVFAKYLSVLFVRKEVHNVYSARPPFLQARNVCARRGYYRRCSFCRDGKIIAGGDTNLNFFCRTAFN